MARILANDGLHPTGIKILEAAGHEVSTTKIPQEELAEKLNEWEAIIVRSATKVRKEHFDASPNLKVVVRAGVGMDNIDVEYGRDKGFNIFNTPEASSRSVAELAMAHLLSLARFLNHAHREMPEKGHSDFKKLKKSYSKGFELQGKTMGIVGFGRIGQEMARISLGLGMHVLAYDLLSNPRILDFPSAGEDNLQIHIPISTMEDLLQNSDVLSIHVPSTDKALIGHDEIQAMKKGMILINTARGGVISETALLQGLESGQVAAAALDVFDNEPTPSDVILNHPKISVSPHIGASTVEAQEKIARLAADKIISVLG